MIRDDGVCTRPPNVRRSLTRFPVYGGAHGFSVAMLRHTSFGRFEVVDVRNRTTMKARSTRTPSSPSHLIGRPPAAMWRRCSRKVSRPISEQSKEIVATLPPSIGPIAHFRSKNHSPIQHFPVEGFVALSRFLGRSQAGPDARIREQRRLLASTAGLGVPT
jgi:hypothetical protein